MEHYAPYKEAVAAGEDDPPIDPLPVVALPSDVWPLEKLLSASVAPIDRRLMAEVALATAWDDEHTLGARFDASSFLELKGSILQR